jgi:SAM-dependent methyltransferase
LSEPALPNFRGPPASYGLDAPSVVRNLILGGLGGFVLVGVLVWQTVLPYWLATTLTWLAAVGAATCFAEAAYCVWSSLVGKLHQREILLEQAQLQGDETVLDVGCGRGLLLIGAAKRLPRGRAVGIDLWQAEDLSRNSAAATLANAAREGVGGRIEVVTGDVRHMPFAAGSFDRVVSSMTIHNIYSIDGRREALADIYRVLKPGGRFIIQDFRHAKDYAEVLRGLGARDVALSKPVFNVYGARVVSGTK